MSEQPEFCKIVYDTDGSIARWVCDGLNFSSDWLEDNITLGFKINNKLIGGLIYHNIDPHRELWWTIYTTDKRWCNRRVLKQIFGLAFNFFKVRRISLLVNPDNFKCLSLVERLGFIREGQLRRFRDNGSDCYIYGLLISENKFH